MRRCYITAFLTTQYVESARAHGSAHRSSLAVTVQWSVLGTFADKLAERIDLPMHISAQPSIVPRLLCMCAAPAGPITPIGPFCPIRSSACSVDGVLDKGFSGLSGTAGSFATEMKRMELDAQAGNAPEPDRMAKLADELDSAHEAWEALLTRLRLSNDFQSREYYQLVASHLKLQFNQTLGVVGALVKWQADCMRAYARNLPPPMPPPGIDITTLMSDGPPPPLASMGGLANAPLIDPPFTGDEEALQSPVVQEEYTKLCAPPEPRRRA